MSHLLHIDSSARREHSVSRRLSSDFERHWRAAHPDGTVTYRDLVSNPIPHLDERTVLAMFTPPQYRTADQEAAVALGEELIGEVEAADTIVIGTPMYNFNIPSALKAWIDRVVVFGRTIDLMTAQGLLDPGKRVVVTSARGGAYGPGMPREPFDYQEPYLRAVLNQAGLTNVTFIHAEMRAAMEGMPNLEEFEEFAHASLASAEAAVLQAAMRPDVHVTEVVNTQTA